MHLFFSVFGPVRVLFNMFVQPGQGINAQVASDPVGVHDRKEPASSIIYNLRILQLGHAHILTA